MGKVLVFIQRNGVILPQTVNNKHNKSMFSSTQKNKQDLRDES